MESSKKSWNKFEKTGRIEDYLQYKILLKKEKSNETNYKESRSNNQD